MADSSHPQAASRHPPEASGSYAQDCRQEHQHGRAAKGGAEDNAAHAAAVATQPATPVVPRTTLPAPTTLPAYVHPDPNVERWHALALSVGWPEAEWAWLSCVVFRESRGMPDAYNGRDRDRSYGLAQLNTKGALWGWYVALGLTDRAQLFDPTTNLSAARAMFRQYGRKPWRADRGSCE